MPRKKLRSKRNAEWIEKYCVVPDGKFVGRPVQLTSEQKKWLAQIYDSPTRTFILSMGRKNGKTCFIAFLVLLHLVGPEAKPAGQIYSTALSRDQAAIVFSLAAKCVRMSAGLRDYVQIRDTAKQLLCPKLGTLYHALSADASTAMGLSPLLIVHDELGQVRGPRSALYEAMETASAAQSDPLSIVISTQAPTDADLLSLLIDDALSGADPRVKVRLYAAPAELDPFSHDAIRAANPHLNVLMNKAEVDRQANEAQRLPSREASYRNLILNQRIEAHDTFISRQVWQENGEQPMPLQDGAEVYGGLDLSSVSDLTALVLLRADNEAFDVHPTFWLPSDGLVEKSRADRVPYDVWMRQGHLMTTPGASIQYEFVAEYLRVIFNRYRVKKIAFDRWNIKFLRPWLEKVGFTPDELERFVEFGQGYVSMSPAIRELEAMLLARKFRHGNHPVLTMCVANATVLSDPAENRKFVKHKTTGRIDGAVALAMAVGVIPPVQEEKQFQSFML